MIGLVLVTHGRLAEEFRLAMEHVVGPQRCVATVCIGPEDDMEQRRQDIRDCVASVDQGDGVVVLTDMFGGTPSNLATSQLGRGGVEVIAGVNLPLLVKLAKVRGAHPLAQAVAEAQEAGRKYIACASDIPACALPAAAPTRPPAAPCGCGGPPAATVPAPLPAPFAEREGAGLPGPGPALHPAPPPAALAALAGPGGGR